MSHDRIPPQALDAERFVLGAAMIDRTLVPVITDLVRPADFYAPAHVPIFAAIVRLYDRNEPTDKIAVAGELAAVKMTEKCGGVAYLSALLDVVSSASSVAYYARIVAEKAMLRRIIAAGARISDSGFDGESDIAEAIVRVEQEVRTAISGSLQGDVGVSLEQGVADVWRVLEAAATGKDKSGISSAWPQLDLATGRTFGGEVVVWASAPQVGKSIAVAQNALHVARHHGQVALFALEMGVGGTVRRMLGKYSGVPSRRIRMGDLRTFDWDRIGDAMDKLGRLPIRLFDRSPRKTVSDVRRCVSRMTLDGPVVAIVIDHANFLAEALANQRISKTERLDAVYQELLQVASEFDCVVHIVQHFNREGMHGEPNLSNLRDGGNLEGHANIVIFPHRPNIGGDPTNGEFIIAKNRESPLRRIPMYFDGENQEWQENMAQKLIA